MPAGFLVSQDLEYLLNHITVPAANGLVHYRLLTKRAGTWWWLLFFSSVDVATVTFAVVVAGGFSAVICLAYYPALPVVVGVFSSQWLSLARTTVTCLSASSCVFIFPHGLGASPRLRGMPSNGVAGHSRLQGIPA